MTLGALCTGKTCSQCCIPSFRQWAQRQVNAAHMSITDNPAGPGRQALGYTKADITWGDAAAVRL